MVAPLSPLLRGRWTGDESFYIPLCRRIKNVIPSQKARCSSMTFLILFRAGGFLNNRRIGPGWPACPAFGKVPVFVVASSVSLASTLTRKLSHAAAPPLPTQPSVARGPRWRQPPFPPAASQRYNTLDLASKIVCHETAGFFGFFRPHRPQAACNAQPLNAALIALQRERRPLWKPPPKGTLSPLDTPANRDAPRPYWMTQSQRGSPPLWTPRIFAAGLTCPTFSIWIAAAKMKIRPLLLSVSDRCSGRSML